MYFHEMFRGVQACTDLDHDISRFLRKKLPEFGQKRAKNERKVLKFDEKVLFYFQFLKIYMFWNVLRKKKT